MTPEVAMPHERHPNPPKTQTHPSAMAESIRVCPSSIVSDAVSNSISNSMSIETRGAAA